MGRGFGPYYNALLLRRTFPDLEKSLIQRSFLLYPKLGGTYRGDSKVWKFPGGESVRFGYLEHEHDVRQYQSSEFGFIGFDELTHFSEAQYIYLFSRLRSPRPDIRVRIRAGTNPGGPGHDWVFKRWGPWLDPKHPEPALPGEVLHLLKNDDGTEQRVPKGTPGTLSRTFIPAVLDDNPFISSQYARQLDELDPVTREQLKRGNWVIKPARGLYFKRHWFEVVDRPPHAVVQRVRYWDRAGTGETENVKRKKTDPDYTVGLLMSKTADGIYYVEDVDRFRGSPHEVKERIGRVTARDGISVMQVLEQDPGQAGKFEIDEYVRFLDGYNVRSCPARDSKITRAQPISAQAEAERCKVVRGAWNDAFFSEIEAFPEGNHDDQVDTLSGAHKQLASPIAPPSDIPLYERETVLAGF